ncbi:MAG: hypothetical protein LJE92_03265 [Gammaproteobacteria bacterium]|jgi:hypothetical protein|nr:hypothetical protein [Gammaproteobacteria bacterium]
MSRQPIAVFGYLLFAAMLAACASVAVVDVPDTKPGDQIQNEYLVGKWCTNREQTATSNQAAGFSGLLNVRPVFWRFGAEGEWDISTSGFLYENYGSWQIDGLDKLLITKKNMEPKPYQVYFKNDEGVTDLYLVDDKGQFTVLSRCD